MDETLSRMLEKYCIEEHESNRKKFQELTLMMRQSDEQESNVKAFILEIQKYAK